MRKILHIDMNSFFASCEQALNPKLKEKPLIVGGDPEKRRGIVLAASYDAKAYGVKTTMPIFEAARLCPHANVITSSHGLYSEMSKKVMDIFDEYTPLKEQLSIDEAFLDMTGCDHLFGGLEKVAIDIQKRIKDELDLGCSIGISSNKLLAKMGSNYKKPMGITSIYPEDVEKMLWPIPVGELYGIGEKSVPKLKSLGIKTIGDLANFDPKELTRIFGDKTAKMFIKRAYGIDNRPVHPRDYYEVKSVGNEITFSRDIDELTDLKKQVLILSESVGFRLRKKGFKGMTISIKIKYSDFSVVSRNKTITELTDSTDLIYKIASELLENSWTGKPIRLIGVSVSNFKEDSNQISLLDYLDADDNNIHKKYEKVDSLTDQLRMKYGYNSIKRASTLRTKDHVRKQ